MKFSQRTIKHANDLIQNYSEFDNDEKIYYIPFNAIPDFQLQKLTSFIYMDNPDFATESTGPDNDAYDRYMMPALLMYLRDSTNTDSRIAFNDAWLRGTTQYAAHVVNGLLDESLDNYNQDHDEAA